MFALSLLLPVFAAEPAVPSVADAPAFLPGVVQRAEVAQRLMGYDIAAWLTSDALVASGRTQGIGRAWFVLDAGEGPTGWYGRYDPAADRWVQVAAFLLQSDRSVVPVEATLDPALADPRARAITRAWAYGFPRGVTRFHGAGLGPNHYVLETATGLDVWVLPALAPDGRLVTTTCQVQHYSADGQQLLGVEVEERRSRAFRVDPGSEVVLRGVRDDGPTVCELYWALYFADDFASFTVKSGGYAFQFVDTPQYGRALMFEDRRRGAP